MPVDVLPNSSGISFSNHEFACGHVQKGHPELPLFSTERRQPIMTTVIYCAIAESHAWGHNLCNATLYDRLG